MSKITGIWRNPPIPGPAQFFGRPNFSAISSETLLAPPTWIVTIT